MNTGKVCNVSNDNNKSIIVQVFVKTTMTRVMAMTDAGRSGSIVAQFWDCFSLSTVSHHIIFQLKNWISKRSNSGRTKYLTIKDVLFNTIFWSIATDDNERSSVEYHMRLIVFI